jgi:hypothetical protein
MTTTTDISDLTAALPPLSFTPTSNLSTALLEAAQAATERGGPIGTVYLIHLDRPYRHARHYTGWTPDLDTRLTRHAKGQGARLLVRRH